MQPLNNLTSDISTTNGSSISLSNTNNLLNSLNLGKSNKMNFQKIYTFKKYMKCLYLVETPIININKVKSPGTVTAYDQNNLLITLLVERDQMNIDSNTVNMTAYNNGTFTINEFLFQAAVPKVSFITFFFNNKLGITEC